MSNSREDRYGGVGRYRRTPPEINANSSGFIAGQGGRTVLPPLTSAFPTSPHSLSSHLAGPQHNQYSSRGTPPIRSEHFSPSYGQPTWQGNTHLMTGQQPYPYSPNESEPRYPAQPYPPYSARQSPGLPGDLHSSRRLPPLNIPHPSSRDDRWQGAPQGSYLPGPTIHPVQPTGTIRSPMGPGYPTTYDPYIIPHGANSYPPILSPAPDTRHHQTGPFSHDGHHGSHPAASQDWGLLSGSHTGHTHLSHSVSPYARADPDMSSSHSPQPETPTEPVIKKKRKRADATQLKILNEVYARTAFPTTEERQELAKKLDMSARSVQIWFQNKRQANRQSRSSANALPPILHRPYGASGPTNVDPHSPNTPGSSRAEVSVTSSAVSGSYARSPIDRSSRATGGSQPYPSDMYRRGRSPEEAIGHHKRPGGKAF
ncbi:homeobox-domain-containing protein [Rickenella mellea]|uniref:Homeobox-domain-containing protein n=1 Tax=Rickenella mellea TaxID=50990 RepID=A0A4Y7QH53_9AGAM|nr:homeobox-domain-containing protein [Rickenella mellea]